MKKVIFGLLLLAMTIGANAQQKGKIRVGLDLDAALPNSGVGIGGDLDIRYNIMDNLNAGIRFSSDVLFKDINVDQAANSVSLTGGFASSTIATGDYYFSSGKSIFAPFVGAGLGLYDVLNINISATGSGVPAMPSSIGFKTSGKFGGLIRGGFELGHFRLALEYNLIPQSDLYDINNSVIGTTANSYLKFTLGFYFGGGHWKK